MDKNGDGVVTKEANIKQDLYAENYYNICFKCKYKYYAKKTLAQIMTIMKFGLNSYLIAHIIMCCICQEFQKICKNLTDEQVKK